MPSRKPRREVRWLRLDQDATNHSLKSIGRCFEDRLNWSLISSSNSLLRHVRSPKDDNRDLHRCPGYLREEITLTCDLSKSAIVSHSFPGLSERCSICHQLIRYTYPDSHGCNDINSSLSLSSTEDIDPRNIGVTSLDAFSVMEREYLLDGQFAPSSSSNSPYTPYMTIQPTDWRHWQHEPNFESEAWFQVSAYQ